jgi:phosphoribosylformimino-5-aminoimidazole carboxamide ribotide isomerase
MIARIVPAIDIIDGKCVRLEQGAFSTEHVVAEDPLEVARRFEIEGYGRLHLVDLSGAKFGEPVHLSILEAICASTSLQVDFSGGLRRKEDLKAAFSAGAAQVVVGSAAVKERTACERWFEHFGPDRVILGVDVLNGLVRVSGWQEPSELSLWTVVDWYVPAGLKTVMSTDIGCDGMLAGPSLSLYEELKQRYPELRLIASGGVSSARDVQDLSQLGVAEIVVGKALYTGVLAREEAREFIW